MAAAVMPFEMPDDEMAYNANAMRLNTMVNAEEVNMRRPKRTKSPVDQIHSNKAESRTVGKLQFWTMSKDRMWPSGESRVSRESREFRENSVAYGPNSNTVMNTVLYYWSSDSNT